MIKCCWVERGLKCLQVPTSIPGAERHCITWQTVAVVASTPLTVYAQGAVSELKHCIIPWVQ